MKNNLSKLFFLLAACSCQSNPPDPLPPQNTACGEGLISRYTYTEKRYSQSDVVTENGDITYDYEFDEHHRIMKIKLGFFSATYPGHGVATIYNFQYDAEGYLLSRTTELENQQELTDTFYLEDEFYTYQNGLLSHTSRRSKEYAKSGSPVISQSEILYEYDANGRLTRKSDDLTGIRTYEYDSQGRVTTYIDASEGYITHTLSNGKIASISYPFDEQVTYEGRYSYDAKGQRIKLESYHNGEWQNSLTYTYDDKKRARGPFSNRWNESMLADLKGHPISPPISGEHHNNRISSSYDNGFQRYTTEENKITYTSNGYPSEIETRYLDDHGRTSTETTLTFQYCE